MVLIGLKGGPTTSKTEPSFLDAAKTLYAKTDYAALIKLTEQHLASQPGDSSAHYLLGVAHLRLGQRDLSQVELDGLSRLQDPVSRSLTPKLGALLKRFDVLEGAKASLREQIGRYDAEGALHAIQQMDVPEPERQLLRVYISVYRGRFELARHQLDALQTSQPDREKEWVGVRTFVDQSASEFRVYSERLGGLRQPFDQIGISGGVFAYSPSGLQELDRNGG